MSISLGPLRPRDLLPRTASVRLSLATRRSGPSVVSRSTAEFTNQGWAPQPTGRVT